MKNGKEKIIQKGSLKNMAQTLEEKIKVIYKIVEDGEVSSKECRLVDIPEDDKYGITSIAIFPVLNKDGSENKVIKNVSKYIHDLPMLQQISLPKQLSKTNLEEIKENGCPNIHKVMIVSDGSVNIKSSTTIHGEILDGVDEHTLQAYASMSSDEKTGIDTIYVPSKFATMNSSVKDDPVITNDEILSAVKGLDDKLDTIAGIIGSDQVPTTEQIRIMLSNFAGTMTETQLNKVVEAVKNINVHVAKDALRGVVESTIENQIIGIYESNNSQFDKTLQNFKSDLLSTIDNNSDQTLAWIKENMPVLLSSDNSLIVRLRLLNLKSKDVQPSQEQSKEASQLVNEALYKYFDVLIKDANLSEENKASISEHFKNYASELATEMNSSGNNPLLEEVIDKMPSIETIDKIINDAFDAHRIVDNEDVRNILLDKIADKLVKTMGGLHGVDINIDNVQNYVEDMFSNDAFVDALRDIAIDSDIARSSEIDRIKKLIESNHKEELAKIDVIAEKIKDVPTYEGLLKFAGVKENPQLTKAMLEEGKKAGMTLEDFKAFLRSNEGREILKTAFEISSLKTNIEEESAKAQPEERQSFGEAMNAINNMQNNLPQQGASAVNIYIDSYGLAKNIPEGGGTRSIPEGFVSNISNPYSSQTVNPDLNAYINNAVKAQVTNALAQLGVQGSQNPNPQRNTKDEVIEKLNQEIAQKDKEISQLKQEIKALNEKLDKLLSIVNRHDAPAQENKDNTPKTAQETPSKPQQKLAEPAMTIAKPAKQDAASIKAPESKKKTFKVKSVEMMDLLSEPKMTRGQKIVSWVKRHPGLTTIGAIGAGLVLTFGASAVAAGGVASLIAHSASFGTSLRVLGIGAGCGALVGGVGEIALRRTKFGKKERLYKKFLKEKEKCDLRKRDLELMEQAIENQKAAIESSLEDMKSSKKLKNMRRYKKANMEKANNLRKLHNKQKELKRKYKEQVESFLEAKRELNEFEDEKGVTTAMGGQLQEIRNLRSQAQEEMLEAEDDEEKEFIQKQLKTEESFVDSSVGKPISTLSNAYKTGDSEAYEMIKNIKDKSETMKTMMKSIEQRNAKDKKVTLDVYEPSEVVEYLDKIEKLKTSDKAKMEAGSVVARVKETNTKAAEYLGISKEKLEQLLIKQKEFEEAQKAMNANKESENNVAQGEDHEASK